MNYVLKLVAIGMITVPAALLTVVIGLFDPHGKHVYGISRIWSWAILKACGISCRVTGLNHIDPKQQYVFIANHQSNIDIPILIQTLLRFQLRWLAKKELLWVPLFGWAMWAAKHVTVNRSIRSDALKTLKKATERIANGVSLVFFPEGTRSPDGRLLPFKRGGVWLAVKTQTPLVPITISGSGALMPKGDWRIRRGEIEVTVGKPFLVENSRRGTLLAVANQLREMIANPLATGSSVPRETAAQKSSIFAHDSSTGS
jgi:1-acyl-sn-glycerol-3-phosphate acyltransferase